VRISLFFLFFSFLRGFSLEEFFPEESLRAVFPFSVNVFFLFGRRPKCFFIFKGAVSCVWKRTFEASLQATLFLFPSSFPWPFFLPRGKLVLFLYWNSPSAQNFFNFLVALLIDFSGKFFFSKRYDPFSPLDHQKKIPPFSEVSLKDYSGLHKISRVGPFSLSLSPDMVAVPWFFFCSFSPFFFSGN